MNNLRKYRDSRHYTQDYVAAELGLSQSQYSRLESGENRLYADQAVALAKIYRVTVDELLT